MADNIGNRQMPIFVSSTFLDLQEERDELYKNTFPKLKEAASRRIVTLKDIDLRWGVTPQDSESGFTLETCLHEIERCLPFFIGIVGDRYGWCPTQSELKKNAYLQERYDWLEKDIEDGLSATEIEMQYAVFRRKEPVSAFFFIKKNRQKDDQAEAKVQNLIGRILAEGKEFLLSTNDLGDLSPARYYYAYYHSVNELSRLVERAITLLLDSLFPMFETEDRWELERRAQAARLHDLRELYVPQSHNLWITTRLDRMSERYMVVTSYDDCLYGKSAFIADWLNDRATDGTHNYIYHFLSAGYLGDNPDAILERLCIEVERLYGVKAPTGEETGHKPDYSGVLSNLLSQIAGLKPLYIVLDGLQYLPDYDGSKMLDWFPVIPDNVCLIATAPAHDATLSVFERRFGISLPLGPFLEEEVRLFVTDYLAELGRRLSENQIDKLLNAFNSAEPAPHGMRDMLTLKLLLRELALIGRVEELDQAIDYFCEDRLTHFYPRLFDRLEQDYGQDIVRLVICLLTYSREGLSETEIVDLVHASPLQWSNIRHSISPLFTYRAGNLCIDKFTVARQIDRYYGDAAPTVRRMLIEHFGQGKDDRSARECLFQYYHLQDFDSLYRALLDVDMFSRLYQIGVTELFPYWKALYEADGHRKYRIGAYADLPIPSTEDNAHTLADIAQFAQVTVGDFDSVRRLYSKALNLYNSILHTDYETLASVYAGLGQCDKAIDSLDQILPVAAFMHDASDTYYPSLLSHKGSLLIRTHREKESVTVLKEALDLTVQAKGEYCLMAVEIYRNLASACAILKEDVRAWEYIEKNIDVIKKVWGEEHLLLGDAFSLYAIFHNHMGHTVEAIGFYRKALGIYQKWLPQDHEKVKQTKATISDLLSQFRNSVVDDVFDSFFGWIKKHNTQYPLSDEEFKQVLNFFEGIVDDLFVTDEGWEDGMKEYDYQFKHEHDCTIGGARFSYGPHSNQTYIYIDSDGMYESCGRAFDNLKAAQVHYLMKYMTFYEQYCDYLSGVYCP